MKKKVSAGIFVFSLLALFIISFIEPKMTGMTVNIKGSFSNLELYTVLTFLFASSIIVSGILTVVYSNRERRPIEAKREKNLKELDKYILHRLSEGRREFNIRQELLAYGWHESYIDNSFNFIKNEKPFVDFHNYSKYINLK